MTDPRFDALIHEPTRLQLCGLLVPVKDVEFGTLRDALDIADSVTSKHLKALEGAGYVKLDKRRPKVGRPRTWVALTERGRDAFAGHLAELQRLATLSPTPEAHHRAKNLPVSRAQTRRPEPPHPRSGAPIAAGANGLNGEVTLC